MSGLSSNLAALRADLASYPAQRAAQPAVLAQLRESIPAWCDLAAAEPEALSAFLRRAVRDEPALTLLLGSALFAHHGRPDYFQSAVAACAALPTSASERFESFIWLNYLLTMHKAACSDADYFALRQRHLAPLYRALYDALPPTSGTLLRPTLRRALICVSHMNNPRHLAFAWDALEFAHHLRADFGYDVLLLNGNFWLRGNALPVWPLQQFTAWNLALRGDWPHRCQTIPYVTLPDTQPTATNLQTAWDVAAAYNPSLVLSVGDANPYADRLAPHRPTLTLHFTVDFPIVRHSMVGLHQDVPETAPALLSQLPPSAARQIFLTPQHYSLPGRTHAYPRAALGLSSTDCVAVVIGHRLDHEVTPAMLKALETVCAALPNLRLVFAGHFHTFEAKLAPYPMLRRQADYIGHVADVRGLCLMADIYINPERTGGGSSAVYAMAACVPVLTLPRGDVAFANGASNSCTDWPDLQQRLRTWVTDRTARQAAAQQAQQRAAYLCDRRGQLANILNQLNIL